MSENQKGLPIKNDEKGHVMTADNAPMASVRIAGEPDDKNINRYELESARRALRLIKGNLGYNRLHALVSEQIAEGNALFRDHVKRSDGKQATGIITLEATGLTAANFSAWMNRAFAREDVLIAAHPEHYLIMSGPNGPHIVETLGDHVVGFYMGSWDKSEVPAGGTDSIDKRHSLLTLDDDGTVFGSISTMFSEAGGGMTVELSVTLPATSAPDAIDQHLQHFSVEFRNWMLLAAAEIREGSLTVDGQQN
ncbi:hypothetical protein ACQVPJ_24500 [Bacillus mycoides]|uniref:Uncharacterized protein n=1 Tax=Bacillus cereus VD021 TaxID=1053224 RepID=R8HFH0_BACCE|nr:MULTISPECIES: hypothetical protein [Bacillus cereus group]EOO71526.1 hypothetical protein IIC_04386 [Bacillus cereus VD021]MCQ6569379.1 hypothetical protein [Bacillus mycoides]